MLEPTTKALTLNARSTTKQVGGLTLNVRGTTKQVGGL